MRSTKFTLVLMLLAFLLSFSVSVWAKKDKAPSAAPACTSNSGCPADHKCVSGTCTMVVKPRREPRASAADCTNGCPRADCMCGADLV